MWCLYVLESIMRICFGTCLAIYPEICHAGKNVKKFMVFQNSHQAHLLGVDLTKFLGDHETLSIVRYVGLYVDFSFMKSLL
jgi:hypothetical protein